MNDLEPILGVQSRRLTMSDLRGLNIIKVPEEDYDAIYDKARYEMRGYNSTPLFKWIVQYLLERWVEDTYPNHRMVASVELCMVEAEEAQRQVQGITFGIYAKSAPKQTAIKDNTDLQLLTS